MIRLPVSVLAVAALVASAGFATGPGDPPAGADLDRATIERSVAGGLDREADPCVDFYRYACGGWLDATELPSDQPIWVRSFSLIHEANRELLRGLIEKSAETPGDDPDRRRVGTFYAACMDEKAVEKAGLEPLAPWLAEIDAAKDAAALFVLAGKLQRIDAAPFFDIDIDGDFKQPTTVVAHFSQGGLGMPERDYYLSDDESKAELRAAYEQHVAKILELAGTPAERAAAEAKAILAFETALARASRPAEQMRIYDQLHHRLDAAGLAEKAPALPWKAYFAALGRPDLDAINVMTPEFFEALSKEVPAADVATLRAYLRYQLVTGTATLLPDAVYQQHFDFYARKLSGQQEPQPRWKRCVGATEQAVGQAVGKLYVAERFSGDSKQVADEMIGGLVDAFEASLPELAWMDDATRKAAREKAGTLVFRIGYPDKWRDYSKLELERGDYFANTLAARELESARQLAKVGGPIDRDDWDWNPQVVNAGYHPLRNDHTYPAGILQPPFFHKDFPAAMNYGAIGYVIGHELTHGFDDQGRKFDAQGRLSDWWTPEAVTAFEQRAACVRDQYSGYEIQPGVAINGELTLGENIGDNGGLKQAWEAFQARKAEHPEEAKPMAGLSADQLFFVAAGQVWCNESSPELERLLVQTDPHSPGKYRVNGSLANHPAFAEAFACAPGTPMNPARKCEVW
jgi:endothelin-converting enzyme/putative endopeptidase